MIAEDDGAGALLRKFIYGPGIDEPLMLEDVRTGQVYCYHFDALGSITEISDSTGKVIEKYEYSVYGRPIVWDAADQILTDSALGNPYLFTGRRYDPKIELFYYRARYYSPALGRFLQTDAVGYLDSMNLYSYVTNNPVNFIDPLGLSKWSWKAFGRGVLKGLVGVAIGVGIVLLLPEVVIGSTVFVVVAGGLAIVGAAGLGLSTGAVITGQTITGRELSGEERSELAGGVLVGWATLFGALGMQYARASQVGRTSGDFTSDLSKSRALTRSGHRYAANKQLHDAMRNDPKLRGRIAQK